MKAGRPYRVAAWAVFLIGSLVARPSSGPAQEPPDSAKLRVLQRLERLGRAPGFDSVLFVRDSLERELALGNRPSGRAGSDSTLAVLLRMPGYSLTEYEGGRATFGAAERVLGRPGAAGARGPTGTCKPRGDGGGSGLFDHL